MWRFAHLTDFHAGNMPESMGNNRILHPRLPEIISTLRRDFKERPPDLMLVTGDLTAEPSRDALFAARDLLDSLRVPYLPVGGNSDFQHPLSRQWFLEAFGARLPVEDTCYACTFQGVRFCTLDPWCTWSDGTLAPFPEEGGRPSWVAPPNQLEWLEEELQRHHAMPVVVALHQPLMPIPLRLRRRGMVEKQCLANGELVMDLLRRRGNVKAVFSGHTHLHSIVQQHGIAHVATGALVEYPVEYREVEVEPGRRIMINTRCLGDARFAEASLIKGREWVQGEDCDRSLEILLDAASAA
jgi:3',5'-cyclic AMP phosphodiesterase CpdA